LYYCIKNKHITFAVPSGFILIENKIGRSIQELLPNFIKNTLKKIEFTSITIKQEMANVISCKK
jgi:hypothetical protein